MGPDLMFTSQSLPQRKDAYSDYSILICSDPVLCDYSAGGALAYICAMCPAAQQSPSSSPSAQQQSPNKRPRPAAACYSAQEQGGGQQLAATR